MGQPTPEAQAENLPLAQLFLPVLLLSARRKSIQPTAGLELKGGDQQRSKSIAAFICCSRLLKARRPGRREQAFSIPSKEAQSPLLLLRAPSPSSASVSPVGGAVGESRCPGEMGSLGPASSPTDPMPPTAPGPEPRRFRWPLAPQDTAGIVRPAAGARPQLRGQGPAVPGDKRAAFFPHEKGTCVPWRRGRRRRKGATGGPGRAVNTPPQGPFCGLEWARWGQEGEGSKGS